MTPTKMPKNLTELFADFEPRMLKAHGASIEATHETIIASIAWFLANVQINRKNGTAEKWMDQLDADLKDEAIMLILNKMISKKDTDQIIIDLLKKARGNE